MNKKLLTVAIAGAMATPMAAHAVKYKLSGQVNRAVVYQDDGQKGEVRNVDNIASGTRWRLKGSEDLGNGMKVGFYYEMQTSSNASSGAFPNQNSDGGNGVTGGGNIRQANVWFSGNWGKLSIGQLDGAANGASESDLSGTAIAGTYAGRTSFTGGMAWRTSKGGTVGVGAGTTYSDLDGFSRYDGIRYDSPALGPVTLSASVGNDSKWDVAARVDTALGGGQLSGALFYGQNNQSATAAGTVDNAWGGSLSFLFSQGTSITGHYSQRESGAGTDVDSWSLKLGHKWGPHAVSVGYGEANDLGGVGNQDTGWNIGYVHSLKKANTELYASYFHQELDVSAATRAGLAGGIEDINAFVVGARVKFN